MKRIFPSFLVIAVGFLILVSAASAYPLINGDFSSGLDSWTVSGDVFVSNGVAVVSDSAGDAFLYQSVALTPGNEYIFSFAYSPLIRPAFNDNTTFGFSDLLIATLFVNSADDIETAVWTDLFQQNGEGFTDGPLNGVGLISDHDVNWHYVSYSFTAGLSDLFLFPEFDLFDLSASSGDFVLIDNVALIEKTPTSQIPEPSTMLLLFVGLAGLEMFRSVARGSKG